MSDKTPNGTAALTKKQARAMLAFLYKYSPTGFDTEISAAASWEWGVRPWPTLDNLVKKGLLVRGEWFGPEEGSLFTLTDAGREYMASVVATRAASTTGRSASSEKDRRGAGRV